jgi:hypothetical protein
LEQLNPGLLRPGLLHPGLLLLGPLQYVLLPLDQPQLRLLLLLHLVLLLGGGMT